MRTGVRYVRNAPAFGIVLVRLAAFVFGYAAIPALLAVAVRTRLPSTVGGYGVAPGVFGAGSVLAAVFVLPRIRSRMSVGALTALGAVVVAVTVLAGVATFTTLPAVLPGLLIGGGASMVVGSLMQVSAQNALPDWVRGRGLAIVQLVYQAALAVGAVVWGALAGAFGTPAALIAAGGATMALTLAAIAAGARLRAVEGLDLRPASLWAAPAAELASGAAPDDGPVLTLVEYEIGDDDTVTFQAAMRDVGRARRRDGALRWSLATDAERPTRQLESYLVSSWAEHQREQSRLTRADARPLRAAYDLHRGQSRPSVRYLLGHHGRLHLHGRRRG